LLILQGAITELIEIQGHHLHSNRHNSDQFVVRYYDSSVSRSMQKVSPRTMMKRGMELSQYKYAFVEYFQEQVGHLAFDVESDDYSVAIQRLHISVVPETLPCRTHERHAVEGYLREGISFSRKSPLYICGMPGTGKTATVLSCINSLRTEVENNTLPDFTFIEINCLRLKSPADACE
jgi:hypothetical protein